MASGFRRTQTRKFGALRLRHREWPPPACPQPAVHVLSAHGSLLLSPRPKPGALRGIIRQAGLTEKTRRTQPACQAAGSRRAASSPPALWPLIGPIVLPRIVVLAAAPGRIVERPATPAEADVVTARDAGIGRARAVDDAALRLVL